MTFWSNLSISSINVGLSPNDGSGDDIRDAFIKVDNNFQGIAGQLGSVNQDWLNANVELQLNVGSANITNFFSPNVTGTVANFTSNVITTNFYTSGVANLEGNTYVEGNIIVTGTPVFSGANVQIATHVTPTANLLYDLGSPTNYFRNVYTKGLTQVNTVSLTANESILELQSNLIPGTVQDIGISSKYYPLTTGVNNYAFFGTQFSTQNFVYKITTTDVTQGNSVVYNGVYGNVQFGSQLLSNTTVSSSTTTGALIVAGGVGIGGSVYAPTVYANTVSTTANIGSMTVSGSIVGSLNVTGVVSSGGYPVLTTGTSGIGQIINAAGSLFLGNAVFASGTPSVSAVTGAVVIPNGGLGVGGNVVASGYVGNFYGTVQTAAQPNITSLGTLPILNVGSGSFSSVGTGTLLASSTATLQSTLSVTGLTTTGGVASTAPITLNNNVALQWKDSNGNARRIGLLSGTNTSYFGDIDNVLGGYTIIAAGSQVYQYVNNTPITTTNSGGMAVTGQVTATTTIGAPTYLTTNSTGSAVTAVLTHGADSNFQLTAQNGPASNVSGGEVARFGVNYYGAGWDTFTQYIRGGSAQSGWMNFYAGGTEIATLNTSGITLNVGTFTGTLSTASQPNITTVGTIIGGTWNAGVISPTYGGTGVNNGSNTLSITGTSYVNQDLRTTASPTFASVTATGQFNGSGAGLTGTAGSLSIGGTAGSETLATVTSRGATTSTAVTFNGGLSATTVNYNNGLYIGQKLNHITTTGTSTNGQNRMAARLYSLGQGLYPDETFISGTNSIGVYDNNGTGTVSVTQISSSGLNAPNNSGYVVQIKHTGSAQSPGYGGFYFATNTRANATFACVFRALLPAGYTINWASNPTGTGGTSYWATDNVGTGMWEDYVYVVRCGNSGSFSSTHFFYITGSPAPSAGSPLTWYLSSANVYDVDNRQQGTVNATTFSGSGSGLTGTAPSLTAGTANGLGSEPYHDAGSSPLTYMLQSNGGGAGIYMVPSSNYPSATGGGASGTWGINVTGSAGSATTASSAGSASTGTTQAVTDNSTNLATTAFVHNILPSGVILMWSGATTNIPTGWYLCNGSNGTPNLMDRFIVGAGNNYGVGATGGSTDAIVVSHTHSASSSSSVSDPGHHHSYSVPSAEANGQGGGGTNAQTLMQNPPPSGSTGTSTTGITVGTSTTISATGSSASDANMPPYYALCYIMKA